MELIESIESINENLISDFGTFSDGRPNFRVVFSDDQYEKRWTDRTDEGFQLLQPEVRLLPKYKQFIHQKYILERLVPAGPGTDLVEKTTYEPAWVFQDANQNYLPPRFDMCKFVVDSIMAAMDKAGTHPKYRDPDIDPQVRKKRVEDMEKELFGNETPAGDALAYGSGVGFTTSDILEDKGKLTH